MRLFEASLKQLFDVFCGPVGVLERFSATVARIEPRRAAHQFSNAAWRVVTSQSLSSPRPSQCSESLNHEVPSRVVCRTPAFIACRVRDGADPVVRVLVALLEIAGDPFDDACMGFRRLDSTRLH